MKNQIEFIKNQIEDLKQTKNICEHIIAFEPISKGSQELPAQKIVNIELQCQILNMELSKPSFEDTIFEICAPKPLSHV